MPGITKMIEKQPSCDDPVEQGLLPVAVALQRMRQQVKVVSEAMRVPLRESLGHVLATDIVSPIQVPAYTNSAMDISDGLFFELERLSKANDIGFDFFDEISKKIGCSGEEYELLFSFDPKYIKKILKIAKKHQVPLNIFAKATKGTYKCDCKSHHF